MKTFLFWSLWLCSGFAVFADAEIWYDWQGKPVAREAKTGFIQTQPSDLVTGKPPIQRVDPPLSTQRWGRGARRFYDFDTPRDGWMAYDYQMNGRWLRPVRASTGLRAWYSGSGNYGFNVQRPGFSLYWHR